MTERILARGQTRESIFKESYLVLTTLKNSLSKYGDVFYFFFLLKIWCLFCILLKKLLFSIHTEFYFFHSAKICQNFQIFMIFFPKIREYVKKYSGYRQVVYCLLYSSFYLPQKDKTSQQDKSFTVQAWVPCSNQCLHLFHTHSSEWNSTTSSFVAEHVLWALSLVLHYICFDQGWQTLVFCNQVFKGFNKKTRLSEIAQNRVLFWKSGFNRVQTAKEGNPLLVQKWAIGSLACTQLEKLVFIKSNMGAFYSCPTSDDYTSKSDSIMPASINVTRNKTMILIPRFI
jgi:hypothetical protein